MKYGLGFDTGGTYTDSVLMDMESGSVIARGKSLTTREDLSIGIRNSINSLKFSEYDKVVLVSMSSTLATNSIVEGKGCRVGLISIGREYDATVPANYSITVQGGHNLDGTEACSLDTEAIRNFLETIRGNVESVAITSYLSVRNPEHELKAIKIADEILNIPVVAGHQLSSSLGFNERTTTSILNARLIPVIRDLMVAVKTCLNDFGIKAPLMIVKGDGTLMGEKIAESRPVETILSGPAASLIGAKHLTGCSDAVIVDIGGTTTDIGILRNGVPHLEKEGAVIAGKRTRVLAAEISTAGLGGDSRIVVNGTKALLTSLRVIPLCIAGKKWPRVHDALRITSEKKSRIVPEAINVDDIIQESEFFISLGTDIRDNLSEMDLKLLDLVRDTPMTLTEAGDLLGTHPFTFNVSKMESRGLIQRIGLTPTDLLAAEGSYMQYDYSSSVYGVRHQSKKMHISEEEFITIMKDRVKKKLAFEIMNKLVFDETGELDIGTVATDLIDKAFTGNNGRDYGCEISINKPIIGIGAPVEAWLPDVAKIFKTTFISPENSDVGNAIGAIAGRVSESTSILITPLAGKICEDPPCSLFSKNETKRFDSLSEAIEYAKIYGANYVSKLAQESGVKDPEISIEIKHRKYDVSEVSDDGLITLDVSVIVTASGSPAWFE